MLLKFSAVALACSVVGCEPASKPTGQPANSQTVASELEHEHQNPGPASLKDAVVELEKVAGTIKAAFAKDDAEAAHEPLHEVGHVLEQMPALADKSTLDDAGKAEVKQASDTLGKAFKEVDKGMHGDGGKKYSDVSESIDASLKVLVEKTKN